MNVVSLYSNCFLCPRRCGIDRKKSHIQKHTNAQNNEYWYCRENAALRLACASIHRGEEPPITGAGEHGVGGGSGTIFVSGCNLGCVYCQNSQISGTKYIQPSPNLGRVVDTAEFAQICLLLQKKGAENINIVTGSHAAPAIAEGIAAAKMDGLGIPVLWNSSAYELPETLEMLEDAVDVFLPDMKTLDKGIAVQFFNAPDYPNIAAAAIKKMLEMRSLRFQNCNSGTARLISGVMVRHLVLPGCLPASRDVLRWFAENCAGRALLSLMFQYTPPLRLTSMPNPKEVQAPAFLDRGPTRYITGKEYETVLGWLGEFGIEDGYCQELVPGNTDWLPDFEKPNPFSSDLSVPVWHWKTGYIKP